MTEKEGVVKFEVDHCYESLQGIDINELNRWRDKLYALGLIGAAPDRYGGLGFGNMSCRTAAGFVITGSQTGHLETLGMHDYAEITFSDYEGNKVCSRGETRPSSESLTHGAVFSARPEITCVFHVHSPQIWRQSHPATAADIPYGTPAMARAVRSLIETSSGLFVMHGHEDGVVSYGTDCDEAGLLLVRALQN